MLKHLREEIILNLDGTGPIAKLKKLAKRDSDCSTYKKGGDLGRIQKGQIAKVSLADYLNLCVEDLPTTTPHRVCDIWFIAVRPRPASNLLDHGGGGVW